METDREMIERNYKRHPSYRERAMQDRHKPEVDEIPAMGPTQKYGQIIADEQITALYRGCRYGAIKTPDGVPMTFHKAHNCSLTGGMFGQL